MEVKEKETLSVEEFARLKRTTGTAVYRAIRDDKLTVIKVPQFICGHVEIMKIVLTKKSLSWEPSLKKQKQKHKSLLQKVYEGR
jgi:hypothetical protein